MSFVMKPRVVPAYSGALLDTINACEGTGVSPYKYAHGQAKPHFPVPAKIKHISWEYEPADGRGWKAGVYMHIRSWVPARYRNAR